MQNIYVARDKHPTVVSKALILDDATHYPDLHDVGRTPTTSSRTAG